MNRRHESHEVLRTFCLKKISLGINKSRPKKATIIFSKRYGKHPFLVPKETVQNSGLWLGSRSWWESAKNHWEGSHFSSKVFFFCLRSKVREQNFRVEPMFGNKRFLPKWINVGWVNLNDTQSGWIFFKQTWTKEDLKNRHFDQPWYWCKVWDCFLLNVLAAHFLLWKKWKLTIPSHGVSDDFGCDWFIAVWSTKFLSSSADLLERCFSLAILGVCHEVSKHSFTAGEGDRRTFNAVGVWKPVGFIALLSGWFFPEKTWVSKTQVYGL